MHAKINQQVNLFQPMFRKERKLLSFKVLVQACTLVLVVLMMMYGWSVQQTHQMEVDLAQLTAKQARLAAQLTQVRTRLAGMKTDTTEQRALAELEAELLARQKVVNALHRVKDSFTQGVSAYLESFSRQTPKGVWLTGFTLRAGGEGLVIRGGALKPALVPSFLEKLSTERALRGTQFGLLQIQREDPKTQLVNFMVYTGSEPPAPSTLLEEGQ